MANDLAYPVVVEECDRVGSLDEALLEQVELGIVAAPAKPDKGNGVLLRTANWRAT